MDNISDTQDAAHAARRQGRVRMAYTLNNLQPVLCTILSDQPYFYMDEDVVEDDEIAAMEQTIDSLERDIADLSHKIDAYETMSAQFASPAGQIISEFHDTAAQMFSPVSGATTSETFIEDLYAGIGKSRMAAELLDIAEKNGVSLRASVQADTAIYDRDASAIFVNPGLAMPDAVLLTVRELRRHHQFRAGAMLHPLTFNPDHGILINRAQRADLAVAMVRAAWEIQLSGEKSVWMRLESSSMGDLARAFAREAFVDFRTLNNGQASAAVFETWFLSERCRAEDKKLIQAMLADYRGYVFGSDQVSRSVSVELLSALGEQPYGKNYLAAYAQMIMTDPVFAEVRDRSNANFLWFIKFERSFRETEQELQSEEGIPSSGVLPEGLPQTFGDRSHETAQSRPFRLSGQSPTDNLADDNVIYVAFGQLRRTQGEAV
jgi:hypothetical protein